MVQRYAKMAVATEVRRIMVAMKGQKTPQKTFYQEMQVLSCWGLICTSN